jgi:cytochrome c-type biogenesis protein
VASLGKFYKRMQVFEKWFRKAVAFLFIAVGIYYGIIYYL